MKKVLILNISHSELLIIKALKAMGHYVIGTGGIATLMGKQYVDKYIQADYSNKELMLQLSQDNNIDAICAPCNDFGVISAAYVAEKLNLPGHDTYQNALTIHHKDKFKRFALNNGISTPNAVWFDNIATAKQWIASQNQYPIIVKPVDLTGGKGVSRADNYMQAISAIEKAFNISRIKHIVIEEYIESSQHAMCTFLLNKKVIALGSNNEYSFENPFRVEIDTYPSDNESQVKDFIVAQVEKMAQILNLNDGIFHVQYRLKNNKPYILEAMRRVLGNLYGLTCTQLNNFDWDYNQAKVYIGEKIENYPIPYKSDGFYAHRNILCPRNGIIETITISNQVKQYVFDQLMLYHKGMQVDNYKNETMGVLYFKFPTRQIMDNIMLNKYSDVQVVMQ